MTIAIISHPDCVLHDIPSHPEQPKRIQVIEQALKADDFTQPLAYFTAQEVTHEQLLRVHPESYIEWLQSIVPDEGLTGIDEDTYMNRYSLHAAYLSAGSVPQAVDLVMEGKMQAAFCNVRPPGHHAEKARAMGFCFFNNVAVGAMHAIEKYKISRVLIVDFDVHHGNGTQDIFQDDKRVMLCSSFEHPLYPGYDPAMDNNHILNLPLPAGCDGTLYRQKVEQAWLQKIEDFQPQLIMFSAGFDAHVSDPLANIQLKKDDYIWITETIRAIAEKYCNGKIVSVLEGGYNLDALAECVPAHVASLVKP